MATTQKTKTQDTTKKKGGQGEKRSSMLPKEHAGAGKPVPAPRLHGHYTKVVRERLMKQFGLKNPHQVPNLTKITLNVGMGEAIKQPKVLDAIVDELAVITGQKPVRTRAKKSIANYGQREGQEIGVAVTLRGARMWEFLDRLISAAIPRIRDFRGLSTRSFDGRGNYSLGVKEQMIFPEINYDLVEQMHGMDLTFVTTTNRDDMAFALLRELGMPFRGDDKPIVVQS
jgi:large subunit ribosomal protein L5